MSGTLSIEERICANAPSNEMAWTALAIACGNVRQSLIYDRVQSPYRQTPVFFELWSGGELVAGIRGFRSEARRLRPLLAPLSRSMAFHGECLVKDSDSGPAMAEALSQMIAKYLVDKRFVRARVSGAFGAPHGLILRLDLPVAQTKTYANAWIDLSRDEEDLLKAVHEKHRAEIRKAARRGLRVEEVTDVEVLLKLMRATYASQDKDGPSEAFVRHCVRTFLDAGAGQIFVAVKDVPVAAAFLSLCGATAAYEFGGHAADSDGGGQLLLWEACLRSKHAGRTRLTLGQVAIGEEGDPKFVNGISRFKRRFGSADDPTQDVSWLLSPPKARAFELFSRMGQAWTR
ncbi:MAG: GNAT family N-acetyltransferase [Vicinamibacteria bacterium]